MLRLLFGPALILSLANLVLASDVTVNLTQTSEAFKNPLKGFRPSRFIGDTSFSDREYASTYKHYIAYTDLEVNGTDTAQKIIDYSNTAWTGVENKNYKVIPRVVIYYDSTHQYWANGLQQGDAVTEWTNTTFLNRLSAFIAKLGQAWDKDPRVGAVEIGLWGYFGEHNIYPNVVPGSSLNDRIPTAVQTVLGNAAAAAFRSKKLLIRYPDVTFLNYNFGTYWDSFALPEDSSSGNGIVSKNNWKTQMETGEVAYDWGTQTNLGGSPDGTLTSTSNTNYVIGWISQTHTSSLGWISEYTQGASTATNAAAMQKAFGYRYVVNSITFPNTASAGSAITVSFNVSNLSVAPFYYPWPVTLNLLNASKQVVWRSRFPTDLRSWLPGAASTVSGTFTLPGTLATGTYAFALSINDPAGDLPSVRFANTNYYTGGFTPFGKIGIGQAASDQNLGTFNLLKSDTTLRYAISGLDQQAPTVPTNLHTTAIQATSVQLAWTSSTDNTAVAGYEVYRNGSWVANTVTSTYTDTGLTSGTTYTYTVVAYDASSNFSAATSGLSVTAGSGPADTQAPSQPTLLASQNLRSTRVSLTWSASSDNVGVTGYEIFRGGVLVGTSTGTTYSDTSLSPATSYSYYVRAYDAAGNRSANSTALGVTTPAAFSSSREAESASNTLAGGAVVVTITGASGGSVVGYVGNNLGTLTLNSYSAPYAGTFDLVISYINGDTGPRPLDVTVNGGTPSTYALPVTGSWTTVGTYTVTVTLNAGSNSLKLSAASGWAPDIDKVVLKN